MGMWDKVRNRTYGVPGDRVEPKALVDEAGDNSDTVVTDNPHALHAKIAAETTATRIAGLAPGEEEVPQDAVIDAGTGDDTEDLRGVWQKPSRELQEVAAEARALAGRPAVAGSGDAPGTPATGCGEADEDEAERSTVVGGRPLAKDEDEGG
jgi:hypothetical protein